MPSAHPYNDVPSAVMRVYLQQRRFDRLRSVRRVARWLSAALVLVLITMTVLRGPTVFGSSTVIGALLVALTGWVVAVVHDFRMQSGRLDSRVCLARLESVRGHLCSRDPQRKRESSPSRRAGANLLTGDDLHSLQAQVRELEHEIDQSEQRVEHALGVAAVASALATVALAAAIGAGASVFA